MAKDKTFIILQILRLWLDYQRIKNNGHAQHKEETRTKNIDRHQDRRESKSYPEQQANKLKDPVSWFTLILAVAAVFQLFAFVISERGILILKGIDTSIEDNGNTVINNDFVNGGKSAVYGAITVCIRQQSLPDKPDYTGCPVSNFSVTPENTVVSLHENFTSIMPFSIKDGRIKMYVFGYTDFRDGFWFLPARKVGFCHQFAPTPKDMNHFVVCKDRNEYFYYK